MTDSEFGWGGAANALYTTEIRGYRYWLYSWGHLHSTSMSYRWLSSNRAECRRTSWSMGNHNPRCNRDQVPNEACKCGIYGWYEPKYAMKERAASTYRGLEFAGVFGVISASGKIIPGTTGFRAERVRIEALTIVDHEIDRGMNDFTSMEIIYSYDPGARRVVTMASPLSIDPRMPIPSNFDRPEPRWLSGTEWLRDTYPQIPIFHDPDRMIKAYPPHDTTNITARPEIPND